jgi:hypothetical protein
MKKFRVAICSRSRFSKMDLAWWMERLVYVPGRNMFETDPALTICADASLTGWGAVCGETSTGMTWTSEESSLHINVLELQAAFNALQSFVGFESNCTIRLRSENSTAVSYINRGHTVPCIERTRHQNSSLVQDQEYFVAGRTFTGSIECPCRQGIPQENRLKRLATAPGGFQESDGDMANKGRPIFEPL